MKLKDLSKITGYSTSTLSKAFSGKMEIPESTREEIFRIAESYGVLQKYKKQTYKKLVIGAIVPELNSEVYANLATTLNSVAARTGITLMVAVDDFDSNRSRELIDYFVGYSGVNGIIFYGPVELKKGVDMPVVSLTDGPDESVDKVLLDSKQAMHDALKHLYSLGHRSVAFIGEPLSSRRYEMFLESATAAGFPSSGVHAFIEDKRFQDAGEAGAEKILLLPSLPTAIVCAYDYIALGAIKLLRSKGYSVPDDFSVIGTDNISVTNYLDAPLASIQTHEEKRCALAFDLIMKKLKNKYYHARRSVTVNAEYVPRGSVSVPRKNSTD